MNLPPLVWDACSLLNLLSTGRALEVVSSMNRECYVPEWVLQNEVLYLRPLERDAAQELLLADPQPLLGAGLLKPIALLPEEMALYVAFAAQMDDGEAQCLAVAANRRYHLMTDDRVAIREALRCLPPIRTGQTPEWLREWLEATPMVHPREIVQRVTVSARFRPPRNSVHLTWWLSLLE